MQEMQKGKVKLVIVAEDASDRTKRKFERLAESLNISIILYGNIQTLSKAIGKENKAIIGIKDNNLATEIERINRGDVNGKN